LVTDIPAGDGKTANLFYSVDSRTDRNKETAARGNMHGADKKMFLDKLSLPCDLDQCTRLPADDHVSTPHLSTPEKKENRINISACVAYNQRLIISLFSVL
jgi:hypothetical protein